MNKKVKLSIFLVLSIIISGLIPFVVSIMPKKEAPQINMKELQKSFDKTLEQTVKKEREKAIKETKDKLLKANNLENEVVKDFAEAFTEYYGKDTKSFSTSYSPDKNLWKMTFTTEDNGEFRKANDTGEDSGWNGYTLSHTFELIEDRKQVKQVAEIEVVRDKTKGKFDISKNNLLIKYLNAILGRELTDKDKNAINIKVNMNFGELTSIEDLNVYIYNGNSLKIGNMIIETENRDDVEKQREFIKFKIVCDREANLTPTPIDNNQEQNQAQ